MAQQLTATLLARVGKFRLRWDRPGKNSLTGLAHEMHLRLKMLLKLLRFQARIGEGRPTRATPAELRYRALALPQHPCRSSYVRPASSRQPEVDRPEEALPAQGQDRRRHTFEPVLPPGHNWDDEGNKSSQCPKHGQCVSAFQKPEATRVAGMYAWNQLGRKVIKGQKAIRILAPMIGTRKKKETEANKDNTGDKKPVLVGFRTAFVFDVSQTEGDPLPDFSARVQGEVGDYRNRLIEFVMAQGIGLAFDPSIAPALGMSYGGRISLLPGMAAAEEFSTLVHELAHELLHKAERRIATTKTVRETEAEAVAFVVSTTIGLDAGQASADYIHLYHGNAALLTESLEVIQRTSALILAAIETLRADKQSEENVEQAQAS